MKYCLVNLFIIALLSCQSNDLTESAQMHFEEKGIVFPKELKHCIIIPGGGCPGCIAAGMDYILNNENAFSDSQQDNMVVFTKINSIKLLKRNLKGKRFEDFNAIIDSPNHYALSTKESLYPIILYLKNGRIVLADVQSPYSDALEKLSNEI